MASRSHIWKFLVTDEGIPLEGATVTVTLAGTATPMVIYDVASGGSPVANSEITTKSNGYFEFWVDGIADGYGVDQKAKISWVSAGVSEGYIDYVDVIFGSSFDVVDVGDTDSTRNKLVSNLLANGWEQHKDFDITGGGSVHGIEGVDETDTNTDQTKLVSNNLAKGWEDHKNSLVTAGAVHGISSATPYSTWLLAGDTKTKLVSDEFIVRVSDKLDSLPTIVTDAYSVTVSILEDTTIPGPSRYYKNIAHGLDRAYPLIDIWDKTTKVNVSDDYIIESVDSNNIKISKSDALVNDIEIFIVG